MRIDHCVTAHLQEFVNADAIQNHACVKGQGMRGVSCTTQPVQFAYQVLRMSQYVSAFPTPCHIVLVRSQTSIPIPMASSERHILSICEA